MRAELHPALASIHALLHIEHNRLSNETETSYPILTDEELYQNSRRIVAAEIQNIVYSEFLPLVLGPVAMEEYKLNLPISGTTTYNNNATANLYNEFATFAFRFGHSLIPNTFEPSDKPLSTVKNICPLKDNLFKIEEFVLGKGFSARAWQNIILGVASSPSPPMDAKMEDHVTSFLFCNSTCEFKRGHGQDLAARNIQRGRDHGLSGYIKYREYCGLSVPSDWSEKPEDISQQNWDNMRSVYTDVRDIDAFTGAMSEKAVEGGLVGPTIVCILGIQFKVLMEGDRLLISRYIPYLFFNFFR